MVEEILPINIYLIYKTSTIYAERIGETRRNLNTVTIVFMAVSLLLSLAAVCQAKSIRGEHRRNMEIFSFFPAEYLEGFACKLDKI